MQRGYASGVIISQPGQTREHARHTPRTESGMYKPPPVGADWTWNPPIIGADGAVLFFRLRQLPASSRPLLSDRDSSAEIAPCSASESSDASELILETSLAAAVRVRNAALCSPVLLSARTHRRLLMAMEPRADLLLRWNPGQTDWGHNGTCGNPINTREPSGDRLMHMIELIHVFGGCQIVLIRLKLPSAC